MNRVKSFLKTESIFEVEAANTISRTYSKKVCQNQKSPALPSI